MHRFSRGYDMHGLWGLEGWDWAVSLESDVRQVSEPLVWIYCEYSDPFIIYMLQLFWSVHVYLLLFKANPDTVFISYLYYTNYNFFQWEYVIYDHSNDLQYNTNLNLPTIFHLIIHIAIISLNSSLTTKPLSLLIESLFISDLIIMYRYIYWLDFCYFKN